MHAIWGSETLPREELMRYRCRNLWLRLLCCRPARHKRAWHSNVR